MTQLKVIINTTKKQQHSSDRRHLINLVSIIVPSVRKAGMYCKLLTCSSVYYVAVTLFIHSFISYRTTVLIIIPTFLNERTVLALRVIYVDYYVDNDDDYDDRVMMICDDEVDYDDW